MNSNTKVSFFRSYATAVQPFRNIVQTAKPPNAFSIMNKLDQDDTCSLHYAADMVKELTAGLSKLKQVAQYRGEVASADFEDQVSKSASPRIVTYKGNVMPMTPLFFYRNLDGRCESDHLIHRPTSSCTPLDSFSAQVQRQNHLHSPQQ